MMITIVKDDLCKLNCVISKRSTVQVILISKCSSAKNVKLVDPYMGL